MRSENKSTRKIILLIPIATILIGLLIWRPWDQDSILSKPNITAGGSIGISGDDLTHQRINLEYTLVNMSLQEIDNVQVIITTTATNNPQKPAILEALPDRPGSVVLKPGERMIFSLEWEFDTSNISEEEKNILEATTIVEAKYFLVNGQEKDQRIFPYLNHM
jgi:hypothetical protein